METEEEKEADRIINTAVKKNRCWPRREGERARREERED